LALYYEKQDYIERQVKNALTYPSVMMLIMVLVIAVLLIAVLPVFDDVYSSLGGNLSGMSYVLLSAGKALKSIMPVICIVFAAAIILMLIFSFSSSFRRKLIASWRRKHGDKGISKKLNDAHFAQVFAMGLKSGLTAEETIELASELLKDTPEAEKRCRMCIEGLSEGKSAAEVFKETQIIPASSCRMFLLGVRAGKGDVVMEEIAEKLLEDASETLENKVAEIEPAMVLAASVLVGVILLSVMLPLMNIMTSIG